MPKRLEEIRLFTAGTVTHPSETDISSDAASYSLNVDPNSREGLLTAINDDKFNIELLSNQGHKGGGDFISDLEVTDLNTYGELAFSSVFAIDISSVRPGRQDHVIRGYETNSGTTSITNEADQLKSNLLFLVVKEKPTWLAASNSVNGPSVLYSNHVGIPSHLNAGSDNPTGEGKVDVNWWKGIWEARYPVEWTNAQGKPDDADFGIKGNYLQFADDDGWLTGSIVPYNVGGGTYDPHTALSVGTGAGLYTGTYYAMPLMLYYQDGTPKPVVSSDLTGGATKGVIAVNCYQNLHVKDTPDGMPLHGWGFAEDISGLGSTHLGRYYPGAQRFGFGIYQPFVSINNWTGLKGISLLKSRSGEESRVFFDSLNSKVHFHTGLEGANYENYYGVGTTYPDISKINSIDMPVGSGTVSSASIIKNGKELHIGTGNRKTDYPIWTGYTMLPQFGEDNEDPVVEQARLAPPPNIPAMHKIVEDDKYIYGIAWYGTPTAGTSATDNTRIYRFLKKDGSYGTVNDSEEDAVKGTLEFDLMSETKFINLSALALAYPGKANKTNYSKSFYNNGTDSFLWVFDRGKGTRGTMYLIERATLSVHKEYPIMSEFNYYDNNTDYITDLHEVFLGGDLGATDVNFETRLYGSAPCKSRTYSNIGGRYYREDSLAATINSTDTTISLNDASAFDDPGGTGIAYIAIRTETISYTGKSGNDLTGCVRGIKVLTDGQDFTSSSHHDAATHHLGAKVVQENWNEYPDFKYCFLFVPRDTPTENIQSSDPSIFKKDFTTYWYHKQELRPLSINLINPGNGQYWPFQRLGRVDQTNDGVVMLSNQKGLQPAHSLTGTNAVTYGNMGGFLDSRLPDQITGELNQPGMLVSGISSTDRNSQGMKVTGHWAKYENKTNTASTVTVNYSGSSGTYNASHLTVEEVAPGACREDVDLYIQCEDFSGSPSSRNGYRVTVTTYSFGGDKDKATSHSTNPEEFPNKSASYQYQLSPSSLYSDVNGASVTEIANTNWKHLGEKKFRNGGVSFQYPLSNRAPSVDPRCNSDDNALYGLRFKFSTNDFTPGAAGSVSWYVTIRCGEAKLDYKPSYIKVSVPRLPFGSVAGNAPQHTKASEKYLDVEQNLYGKSREYEDMTFNMITEPGETGTGMIIPEHNSADKLTDNRIAAFGRPFVPLAAGGSWATLYISSTHMAKHSDWDATIMNSKKSNCNNYFFPHGIGMATDDSTIYPHFNGMNERPIHSYGGFLTAFGRDITERGYGGNTKNLNPDDSMFLNSNGHSKKITNLYHAKSPPILAPGGTKPPISLSFWMQLDNSIGTYRANIVSLYGDSGTLMLQLEGEKITYSPPITDNAIRFYLSYQQSGGSYVEIDAFANDPDTAIPSPSSQYSDVNGKKFVHIGLVVEDTSSPTYSLYLSGEKHTLAYGSGNPMVGATNIEYYWGTLTGHGTGITARFSGLAAYHTRLTQSDMNAIYNEGEPINLTSGPSSSDLKIYYHLASENGWAGHDIMMKDFSGQNNDGSSDLNPTSHYVSDTINYPGQKDAFIYGTLASHATPLTENNIYFWGEDMLGDLENTPTTVDLKLRNPPICFTYHGGLDNTSEPSVAITHYHTTNTEELRGYDFVRGNSSKKSSNGSTVFYLGNNGLVEENIKVGGLFGAPLYLSTGGFKGALHPELSVGRHLNKFRPATVIDNYLYKYRAYSWPIIYNSGNGDSKFWNSASSYIQTHTNFLPATNLTYADANRPFSNGVHVNISRKFEGPCSKDVQYVQKIVSPTDYDISTDVTRNHYIARIAADQYEPINNHRASIAQNAKYDDNIKSFSAFVIPIGQGDDNMGTIVSKVEDTADTGNNTDHDRGWKFYVSDYDFTTRKLKLNFWQKFTSSDFHCETLNAVLPVDTLSQVGFTYDNSSYGNVPVIYINGVSQQISIVSGGQGTAVSDVTPGFTSIRIGATSIAGAKNFAGFITDIAIFTSIKSAANMLSFYNNGERHNLADDSDATDIIGYWDFYQGKVDSNSWANVILTHPTEGTIDPTEITLDSVNENLISMEKIPYSLNIFDGSKNVIDPLGWDGKGFANFTFFTNNSILPAKGENTIGLGHGLSIQSPIISNSPTATTNSHNSILVPPIYGFAYPSGSGTGYGGGTAQEHFWKAAFIYDGIQEGELSLSFMSDWDGSSGEHRTVKFSVNPENLSKRVSHVMFFRAYSDIANSIEPDSFYRLVKSIRLDDTVESLKDSIFGERRVIEFTDTGLLTSTYDAITGISSTVENTLPNYKLSVSSSGSLFIADCYHLGAGGAMTEYLFKSKPYKYDQFDWTVDYISLPGVPTALASFNGKVYAFTSDKTLRINPTSLYVEDEFEGVGCLNKDSVTVTEYGMFFMDKNNLYLHSGGSPQPIGRSILKSQNGTIGFQEIMDSYDPSVFEAKTLFDNSKNAVMFLVSSTKAWVYSIQKERWDLWEISDKSQFYYNEDGEVKYIISGLERGKFVDVFISNTGSNVLNTDIDIAVPNIIDYGKDTSLKRSLTWESKRLNMDIGTQEKFFYQIDADYNGDEPTITYGVNGGDPSSAGTKSVANNHIKVKIASNEKKKKNIKLRVSSPQVLVGSVTGVSVLAYGILADYTGSTWTNMAAGTYTNIPTIDYDKNKGTGCTVDFTIVDHSAAWGDINFQAENANAEGAGKFTMTTTNNHGASAGQMFSINPSDAKFNGFYEVDSEDGAKNIVSRVSIPTGATGTFSATVLEITNVSVNTGGSGYETGQYLFDSMKQSSSRLLIKQGVFPGGTIGNRARIILNIDSVSIASANPTEVDTLGVIFRPPSKVKQ